MARVATVAAGSRRMRPARGHQLPADSGGTVWDLHPLPVHRRAIVVRRREYNIGDMPRRSTATVRRKPVEKATMATGSVAIYSETLTVETTERVQVMDLTELVMEHVHRWPLREGLVTLASMHTTLTLFINEHQRALLADMKTFLEQIVKDDHEWLHNDPDHSDCDRANADSHLRALLLGHSITLPLSGGEIVLGQWQRILMGELDGPRPRSLRLQVMGVAEVGA